MRSCKALALAAMVCIAIALPARADEVYTFVVKKQEEKQKTRWSLSEWLDTRDRMRMMDLWLALHSPSPYEFYVGGDYQSVERDSGRSSGIGFHAAAYASIFGLELQKQPGYDSGLARLVGLFHLRIFGFHAQGTNITLQTGLRNQSGDSQSTRQPLAGIALSVAISKYFGVDGLYRHYFTSTPGTPAVASGSRYDGGAFVDFSMFRVYGKYFSETTAPFEDRGVAFGGRLYF